MHLPVVKSGPSKGVVAVVITNSDASTDPARRQRAAVRVMARGVDQVIGAGGRRVDRVVVLVVGVVHAVRQAVAGPAGFRDLFMPQAGMADGIFTDGSA